MIVGQGLAGSCLALQLMDRGKRVLVLDDEKTQTSSMVAAGLYNPITGRKMVKTWLADVLFPYLQSFYQRAEHLTGTTFLVDRPIYRPFFSVEEQNEWMGKSAEPEIRSFIARVHMSSPFQGMAHDPFGGLEVAMAGNLQIPRFLEAIRTYLKAQGSFQSGTYKDGDLSILPNGVKVAGAEASKLVFCSGLDTGQSNFFSWLPFRPVKGEILTIAAQLPETVILNRGVFVLPMGNRLFRVGSTYDHHDLSWHPTEGGRVAIEENLQKIVKVPYQVVDHVAGIRPATKDRRPILGTHPMHETIAVFNGLGTKGVSLAPYFSEVMADYLTEGKELPDEVNCNRFFN
jgi:glycine oxidase